MASLKIPAVFRQLFKPARRKAYYGGRGSGKSHSFAGALLVMGTLRPLRILCCREIQKSIEDSVKRLLDDKIAELDLGEFYQSQKTEISGVNGTLFRFAGLRTNPDTLKSFEGIDIGWVEEANTVSQHSLDLLIPTIRKEGSELWFSWNPRYEDDPVDAMFRSGTPPPGSVICEVNFADNPWFPKVLREEMEWDRNRDPAKYAHVWLGEYLRNGDAQVFHNWRVEPFETPKDARFYFGADWGYAVDPTVLVRCWIKDRTLHIDQEAYAVGCEIDRTPELFEKVPGSRDWQITADSARPETISYMQRHGFPRIRPALKGSSSVMDGIEFLKSYDIVVHPSCRHVADELALYRFKTDPQTDEVLPVLEDKKNHTIDALRYALESVRRATVSTIAPLRI